MRDFLRCASAETLKLKRTLALWMALLAPLLMVTLQCGFVFRIPSARLYKAGLWPILQQGTVAWAFFLLPLLAALETALINGVDHREQNWRHLFARPIARRSVYAAKLAASHLLLALASLALGAGLLAAGIALHRVLPRVPYGPPPVADLMGRLALIYLASGALISMHLWVSARARSFPVPLGLGVAGVMVSIIASSDAVTTWWPWMFPVNVLSPARQAWALALGVGAGLVAAVCGAWETCRRDVL